MRCACKRFPGSDQKRDRQMAFAGDDEAWGGRPTAYTRDRRATPEADTWGEAKAPTVAFGLAHGEASFGPPYRRASIIRVIRYVPVTVIWTSSPSRARSARVPDSSRESAQNTLAASAFEFTLGTMLKDRSRLSGRHGAWFSFIRQTRAKESRKRPVGG